MPRLFMPVLSALFVIAVFWAAGISLGVGWVPRWTSMDAEAVTPPVQLELAVHAARRCPHCGWIESKREILSTAANPRALGTYEYTLRRNDGSSSVFQETLPIRWRLGEQLIFIDGADRLAAPAATGSESN